MFTESGLVPMRENRRVAGTVQLFATCLGDLFFPEAVDDAATLLREAGVEVVVPAGQVCCGQPAFNSGHRRAARRVARTFVRAFDRELPVVVPSGSCATMLAHYLPELVDAQPYEIYELSAYLDAAGAALRAEPGAAARLPRLVPHAARARDRRRRGGSSSGRARRSCRSPRPDLCCGFGGTFSVRQPEVSVALADEKLAGAGNADALVTADPGCLMHLRGRAARTDGPRVVHLASALARGSRRERARAAADRFRAVAQEKLDDERMQSALRLAQGRLYDARLRGWDDLPDVEAMRDRAREVRTRTIEELDRHLDLFQERVEALGGQVHRCGTAAEAAGTVVEICRRADAKLVAKSKSMVTEEIRLNEALEAAGIRPVETDLGEYIRPGLQSALHRPGRLCRPVVQLTGCSSSWREAWRLAVKVLVAP